MPLKLQERDVTKQFCDYLGYRGWTLLRLQAGLFQTLGGQRTVRMHAAGTPDWLALKPDAEFFAELKRPGAKPKRHQELRMSALRKQGFRAEWFDSVFKGEGKRDLETWLAVEGL